MNRGQRPDPWIGLLLALTAGPVIAGLLFMLLYSTGLMGLLAHGFTLQFWGRVLADTQTWISLIYSLLVGGASLGSSLVLALALQSALGDRLHRGPLRGLLFLPLAVPPLVAALLSVEIIGNAGLFARLAHLFGWIERPEDFPTLLFTPLGIGIILTHLMLVTPFLLLLLDRVARNEQIESLVQVAHTLGASRWTAWRQVSLPILLRASLPVLSVYLLALMGAFEIPLLVGAQAPPMISVLIQRRSQFDIAARPEAYALACLYAALAMGWLWRARHLEPDSTR